MQKHVHQLEVDWPVHLLVHSLLLCLKGQNVILRKSGKTVSHFPSNYRSMIQLHEGSVQLTVTQTYLQRVPEGESEGAGGLIDRIVARNARAEHDHVDECQEALPVLYLV